MSIIELPLKEDIGIDEIADDQYQIIIMDATGVTIGVVYGKTHEQAEERAKFICESVNLSGLF